MTKFWFSGGNQKDERPNESYYYGTNAYNTSFYEQNLDILDSAEGWIGSAVDLARFLVHVDGRDVKPDIIEKTHFDTMTTPSEVPNPYNYAKGIVPILQNTEIANMLKVLGFLFLGTFTQIRPI